MNISFNDSSTSSSSYQNNQCPEKIKRKFEEIISKTSKNGEWTTIRDLYQYQGFWYYERLLQGTLLAQEQFKAQPNDIILCTTPESGSRRLKALALAILNRTSSTLDESRNNLHLKVPCLETDLFSPHKKPVAYPKVPIFATHIPYASLPKSIIDSKCKIVYMCRNPKDVLFSLWRSLGTTDSDRVALSKAYRSFCKGVSVHGPFWDHVMGYWEATMKWPDRVLFLTYEKLESETSFNVRRLAQFMGCPFSLDEERRGVVRKICSKKTSKEYHLNEEIEDQTDQLITKEMKDHIDQITKNRFKGSGLVIG